METGLSTFTTPAYPLIDYPLTTDRQPTACSSALTLEVQLTLKRYCES